MRDQLALESHDLRIALRHQYQLDILLRENDGREGLVVSLVGSERWMVALLFLPFIELRNTSSFESFLDEGELIRSHI